MTLLGYLKVVTGEPDRLDGHRAADRCSEFYAALLAASRVVQMAGCLGPVERLRTRPTA